MVLVVPLSASCVERARDGLEADGELIVTIVPLGVVFIMGPDLVRFMFLVQSRLRVKDARPGDLRGCDQLLSV